MSLRLVSTALFVIAIAGACECTEPTVQWKKDHSDVVFRGTIIALRASDGTGFGFPYTTVRDTKKIAVFQISRVWKGEVGEIFEMPAVEETSMCIGFWPSYLKIGNDLIVYASRHGSEYFTGICGYNKPAKDANNKDAKDLRELGLGEAPTSK